MVCWTVGPRDSLSYVGDTALYQMSDEQVIELVAAAAALGAEFQAAPTSQRGRGPGPALLPR